MNNEDNAGLAQDLDSAVAQLDCLITCLDSVDRDQAELKGSQIEGLSAILSNVKNEVVRVIEKLE